MHSFFFFNQCEVVDCRLACAHTGSIVSKPGLSVHVHVQARRVSTDWSGCHCHLLNVTRWRQANWHGLKSVAHSRTQSLSGWAWSLWAPPPASALTPHSHRQTDPHPDWPCCVYTHIGLCEPNEMSPKTVNPAIIQTASPPPPSSVNNSIWALFSQRPSNATWERSPGSSFSRWDHTLFIYCFIFRGRIVFFPHIQTVTSVGWYDHMCQYAKVTH